MKLDYNLFIIQSMIDVITSVEKYRRAGCCNYEIATLSDTANVMNILGYKSKTGNLLTEVNLKKIIQRVKEKFSNYQELLDIDFDSMQKYQFKDEEEDSKN